LKRINPQVNIVCTLGSNGVAAMDVDGQRLHLAAEPVPQVLDSIGAGDCFIAGLLRCLLRQQALEEAMVFANKLAANFIQQQGIRVNV
jgi:sugar/nucleoside kinase (ribokinase family)